MRNWLRPPPAVPGISGVSGSGIGDQNPAPMQHATVVKAATEEQAAGSEEEPLVRLPELSDPPGPSPIPRRLTLPEIPEIPETSRGPGLRGVSGISGISGKVSSSKNAPPLGLRSGRPNCRKLRLQTPCRQSRVEKPLPLPMEFPAPRTPHRPRLHQPRRPWSAADWRLFHNDRQLVAEVALGKTRGQARAYAYVCCIQGMVPGAAGGDGGAGHRCPGGEGHRRPVVTATATGPAAACRPVVGRGLAGVLR